MSKKDIFGRYYNEATSKSLYNLDDGYEKDLKKMDADRRFNYKLFNKGKEWFDSGLTLEDASEELRNDQSFIKGYEHGKRLAEANNMNEEKGTGFSR